MAAICFLSTAHATPQFARETGLTCNSCHTHPPLLNAFGQRFYANGFRLSKGTKLENTLPLWASLGAQGTVAKSLGSSVPISYATTEVASYGQIDSAQLLYHLEYQPTEKQSYIYAMRPIGKTFAVQAGEIGLFEQWDPRLDINLTRPVFLQPGGAGSLGNGRSGPFAPGANAYGVRFNYSITGDNAMPYADGWKLSAAVPFSDEAPCGIQPTFDKHASGVFIEAFRRMGVNSYGVNMFDGRDGRRYYGIAAQQKWRNFFIEGGASYATFNGAHTGLISYGAFWTPTWDKAIGFRVDDQDGYYSYVPTVSLELGGKRGMLRLVGETTIIWGVAPTTIVTLQAKF